MSIPCRASSEPLKIAVLGSGSGSNFQSILDAIDAGTLNARAVIVISDVPGALILERARRRGIPALHLDCGPSRTRLDGEGEARAIEAIVGAGADVVVLAGFMRIVKHAMLSRFAGRILNIHPSLLPSFPGLAAWKQALAYGVKVTGCTVHLVDKGTDTGPILVQRSVPVLDDDTPETLHARIQKEEHVAYPAALRLLADGRLSAVGRCVVASALVAGAPKRDSRP